MTTLQQIKQYPIDTGSLIDGALSTLDKSLSENTVRAYKRAIRDFSKFCSTIGIKNIQNATEREIILFLQQNIDAGKAYSTLNQTLSGISSAFRFNRNTENTPANSFIVRQFMQGARRKTAGARKHAKPIMNDMIKEFIEECSDKRDRALVLIGWSAALRRSEIRNIRVRDLIYKKRRGLQLYIPRSKTDQSGAGYHIAIVNKPTIQAVNEWIQISKVTGYLFPSPRNSKKPISGQAIADIFKKYFGEEYSPHGARSGFMTSAAENGAAFEKILEVSRHKNPRVALDYVKDANKFHHHAGRGLI